MARMIRIDRDGPIRIDPQDKPVFVCGCGLTHNFPHCDGSHKACKDEAPGTIAVYDADGRIIEQREDTPGG